MAGVDFGLLAGVVFFLFAVWGAGRLFRRLSLPSILGELIAGILFGPHFLDIVPFASDGTCDTVLFEADSLHGSMQGRALAGISPPCQAHFLWSPRWSPSDSDPIDTKDIWSFAGTVGVTLLIMESGMHINFEKVRQIGGQAFIVAIVGTAMPLIVGMLLAGALFDGRYRVFRWYHLLMVCPLECFLPMVPPSELYTSRAYHFQIVPLSDCTDTRPDCAAGTIRMASLLVAPWRLPPLASRSSC